MRCNRRTLVFAAAGLLAAGYGARLKPAAAQEAASSPGAGATDLVVYADMVQGAQNVPEDQREVRACVLSSRFPRNAEVVWRIRVIDRTTGEAMDDTMLDSVVVQLSDGQVFEAEYGPHPGPPRPPRDFYWTADWLIPQDYPTGTFNYTIVATDTTGRTGEFKPFDIPPSLPAVTDEVLQDVEE